MMGITSSAPLALLTKVSDMKTFAAAALSVLLVAGLPPADSPAGDEFSSVETVARAGTQRVPAPPAGAREGDWHAVGPTETVILEDKIDLDGGSSTTAPSRGDEVTAQPLLNPISIGLCNAGRTTHVIEKFTTKHDGTVSLRCGHSGGGYVHIRARHQQDWQNTMTGPGLWDDFMVYASREAMKSPSSTKANREKNTRCYKTPIKLYRVVNGQPQYVKTRYPRVAVSMNNKVVVTSYPTSTPSC